MTVTRGPALGATARARDTWFVRKLLVIVAVGLILRIVWVVADRNGPILYDGSFYFHLADGLSRGTGFVDPYAYVSTGRLVANANHTPAWPVLLAIPHLVGLRSVLFSQLFACLVGTATIAVVGYAGRAVRSARVGLIAAAICALYPNFWVYERELMSETLELFLIACLLLVAYRFWAAPGRGLTVALGALCGLLTLTHPNNILLVLLLLVPLHLCVPTSDRRRRVRSLAISVLAAIVVVAPWVVFNERRFEQPVFLTTALGLTLVTANCPSTYYGTNLGSLQLLCAAPRPKTGDASEIDAEWRRRGQHYVSTHASRLPVVVAARELRTWGLFRPLQQTHLDAHIGSPLWLERLRLFTYWLLAPAAIAGAVVLRRQRVTLIPLGAVVAEVIITVALTFGDTRYRAPAEVVIALLAAVFIDAAWSRRRRARPRAAPSS